MEEDRKVVDAFWRSYNRDLAKHFGSTPQKIYKNEVEINGKILPVPDEINRSV